jgi:hypothetical protein
VGQQPQEVLEQLINIKYMRLQELAISMEMCSIGDKHVLLIAEGLEKNKEMKALSLSFWKYPFRYPATTSRKWDSKPCSRP